MSTKRTQKNIRFINKKLEVFMQTKQDGRLGTEKSGN